MDPNLRGGWVAAFELVGGVDLGVQFDCFHGRTLEPHRIRTIAAFAGNLHRFGLERAAERIGVVLQHDDALDGGRLRIDQDEAAFENWRRTWKGGHVRKSVLSSKLLRILPRRPYR